jgi:hypothetical protein
MSVRARGEPIYLSLSILSEPWEQVYLFVIMNINYICAGSLCVRIVNFPLLAPNIPLWTWVLYFIKRKTYLSETINDKKPCDMVTNSYLQNTKPKITTCTHGWATDCRKPFLVVQRADEGETRGSALFISRPPRWSGRPHLQQLEAREELPGLLVLPLDLPGLAVDRHHL